MESQSPVSKLFQKEEPDLYFSPESLKVKCAYEIKKGELFIKGKGKLGGFDLSEINTMEKLYDIIHPEDIKKVIHFATLSINHINEVGVAPLEHQSKINFRVKGKDGKLHYIQRHGIGNGTRKGLLVSNFTFIEDVTWMRPRPGSWKLMGPGQESFDFEFPEIALFKNNLSARELEVLKLVARGFQSKDIAEMLHLSKHTIETHRRNMVRKLDVANSMELVSLARDMGLLD